MVRRPDAGPVVAQRAVPIAETDTVRELYAKMVEASGRMMAEVWPAMPSAISSRSPG
jgi:methionyl-tRNA formyltransferase